MLISLPEGPRENIYSASNEWGDRNTLSVPLNLVSGDWVVVDAKLQGFIGSSHPSLDGMVTEHNEEEGVYEVYVPLSGSFKVTRDGEESILTANAADLREFCEMATILIDDGISSVKFRTTLTNGNEIEIGGFIIKPGVMHSAEMIKEQGSVCRYVSVKLKKKEF